MKIVIEAEPKEIADLAILLQSRHTLVRKPYSDKLELVPVGLIHDDCECKHDKSSKHV